MVFFWNKKINCFLYHAWPVPPGIHQWRGLHVGPVGRSPPSASFITLMGCYLQAALSGSPQLCSAPFSAHSFHIHPNTRADLTHNQTGREGSRRRGRPGLDRAHHARTTETERPTLVILTLALVVCEKQRESPTFPHCSSLWAPSAAILRQMGRNLISQLPCLDQLQSSAQ